MASTLPSEESALLALLLDFSRRKNKTLYLVGGFLRDYFLKRAKSNYDFDFCLEKGALAFARGFAKELEAGFVVLDEVNRTARVVKKLKNRMCTFDFTDFRGKGGLSDDLRQRDFTIDTLAVELGVMLNKGIEGNCIDFCAAREDMRAKIIRAAYTEAFDEDPLRIVRAFSLAALFGFEIEKRTLALIKKKRALLQGVSNERVRDELFRMFESRRAAEYLSRMDEQGILTQVIPELEVMRGVAQGPYHHLDVFTHSIESVRQLDLLFDQLKGNKDIAAYLKEPIAGTRPRRALLTFGTLLHDLGKPAALRREEGKIKFHGHEAVGARMAEAIALRLKLSNDEAGALKKMVFCHLRPGYLGDNEEVTARAQFRYFRDTAEEGASILLLSLADQRSTKGPLTTVDASVLHEKVCRRLLREFFRRKKEKKMARLVNGDDLMKEFQIGPSALIGGLLNELDELQAIGKISSKADALRAAARFLHGRK